MVLDDIIKLLEEAADAANNVIIYDDTNFSYDKEMYDYSTKLLLEISEIIKRYNGEIKKELELISFLLSSIFLELTCYVADIKKINEVEYLHCYLPHVESLYSILEYLKNKQGNPYCMDSIVIIKNNSKTSFKFLISYTDIYFQNKLALLTNLSNGYVVIPTRSPDVELVVSYNRGPNMEENNVILNDIVPGINFYTLNGDDIEHNSYIPNRANIKDFYPDGSNN